MQQPRDSTVHAKTTGPAILVVGNLDSWKSQGRPIPILTGFYFTSFQDVTADLLQHLAPYLVLSALMGDDYDVIDLARKLARFEFVGRYRALVSGLPNPKLILNEVRSAAPQIDFDLFDLDRDQLLRR